MDRKTWRRRKPTIVVCYKLSSLVKTFLLSKKKRTPHTFNWSQKGKNQTPSFSRFKYLLLFLSLAGFCSGDWALMGQKDLLCSSSRMIFKAVVVFLVVGLLGLVFQATQLPPPQDSEASVGLPVSSPRIRLRDGRFLAYRERGVSKNDSIYRIIVSHGFGSSKDMNVLATQVWFLTLTWNLNFYN